MEKTRGYFFFHNLNTCIGCCACQTACKDKNNLCPGEFFRRVEQVPMPETGRLRFYSGACCHCGEPACVAICPNGAFFKAEDGTVLHDDGKCIGCGKCLWACPYGAISLSLDKGVAHKCDGCYDLRQKGLEPACVAACVNRSLQFGKTDGRCGEAELVSALPEWLPDAGTDPSIRIHLSQNRREKGEG